MVAEWQLNGCCGTEEIVFLCFYAGYVVAFAVLFKTALMKPVRLLAVFLHEFSHAFLCWITGGKVEAIEVNTNEGKLMIRRGFVNNSFFFSKLYNPLSNTVTHRRRYKISRRV
jgi:hypothetical protein